MEVPDVVYFKRLAASGVVGDSGKAIDIIGYSISSGATAGVLTFKNGVDASSPVAWADTATVVSQENSKNLGYPVRLDNGCYASFDTNVSAATIFYRQMYT